MHHLSNNNIRNKIKQTNLERYGFENPGCNKTVDNKRKQTNLERYGFENPMQNPEIIKKSVQNRIQISRYLFPENMKSKTIKAWTSNNPRKILDTIYQKIKLDYTECTMMLIYKRSASIFMNKYHIYGWDNRGKLCIGWVYKNELVQLITFGKAKNPTYTYQIYQACTHPKYYVNNGLYKLYEHAVRYFEIDDVILYEDAEYSHIGKDLGLTYLKDIPKIKIWYHNSYMIPDDQVFNRDLIKLFGPESNITKKELLFTSNCWSAYNKDFLVFVHNQNHTIPPEIR